jgi:hypothetical protein
MTTLARNPEVIYTELEDGAVLLNMENGYYYSLDAVGAELWRLVGSAASPDEIGRRLTHRFDVTEERASVAAARFVDNLRQEHLVVSGDGGATSVPNIVSDAPSQATKKQPFRDPVLIKHDEPLSQISLHPFDPQLPLAE